MDLKYNSLLYVENKNITYFSKAPLIQFLCAKFNLELPKELEISNGMIFENTKDYNLNLEYSPSHIFIKGIGGIGKSENLKKTFDFIKSNNSFDLSFYRLTNFVDSLTDEYISADKKIKIVFLDGLDEISDENKIKLSKQLSDAISHYANLYYIISGRSVAFIKQFEKVFEGKAESANLIPYNSNTLHYFGKSDNSISILENAYKGTVFYPLISIPLYRSFLESSLESHKSIIKNLNEFYTKFIDEGINKSIEKYATALNKNSNLSFHVKEKDLKRKIKKLAFNIFIKNTYFFTIDDLSFFTDSEKYCFLDFCGYTYLPQNSRDIKYQFSSIFFYEYFVALSLSDNSFVPSTVCTLFFQNGNRDVNLKNINILIMIIGLLPETNSLYKSLKKNLDRVSPLWILNSEFYGLSDTIRYNYFNRIIKLYNDNEDFLYYGRFLLSNDISNTIPDLIKRLLELLPESKENDFLAYACSVITGFIENPSKKNYYAFFNYSMLLGIYQRQPKWNPEQQEFIRPVINKLIKYFLNNEVPNRLKGAFSSSSFFYFYKTYGWTKDWNTRDFENLINNLLERKNISLHDIIHSNEEYFIKYEIFTISDYKLKELEKPLLYYILTKENENDIQNEAIFEPESIDDSYEIPMVHLDWQVELLKYHYKQNSPDFEVLLDLLNELSKNNFTLAFDSINAAYDIWNSVVEHFSDKLNEVTLKQVKIVTQIFIYFCFNFQSYNFDKVRNLSDSVKLEIIDNLKERINTLSKVNSYLVINAFIRLIVNLLFLSDENKAKDEILFFETSGDFGKSLFMEVIIQCRKNQEHILYNFSNDVFNTNKLFSRDKELEQLKIEKEKRIEENINIMQRNEINILLNPDIFISEIKKVFDFIESHPCFPEDQTFKSNVNVTPKIDITQHFQLIHLRTDSIRNTFLYKDVHYEVPVFSQIVIQFLLDFSFNNSHIINKTYLFSNIEKRFRENYWNFIYDIYFSKINENENNLYFENTDFVNKVKESFEFDITHQLENNTYEDYITCKNLYWVKPFIKCFDIINYSKTVFSFSTSDKLLNLLLFPVIRLNGMQLNANFSLTYDYYITDWLNEHFGIDYKKMFSFCLEMFEKIEDKDTYIKAQLLSYLIKLCEKDIAEQENNFNIIKKIIYNLTKEYIRIDYQNRTEIPILLNVLEEFWRNERVGNKDSDEYVDYICSLVDLSVLKINNNNVNGLTKEVLLYFIENANSKKRYIIIKKFKRYFKTECVTSFLSALGEVKSQIRIINNYLENADVTDNLFEFKYPFGFLKKDKKVMKKWIKLFFYSLDKNNYRREILLRYATIGIKSNINKKSINLLNRKFSKNISILYRNNKSPEYAISFWNSIKQTVYVKTKKPIKKAFLVLVTGIVVLCIFNPWSIMSKKSINTTFTFIATLASLLAGFKLTFIDIKDKIEELVYRKREK